MNFTKYGFFNSNEVAGAWSLNDNQLTILFVNGHVETLNLGQPAMKDLLAAMTKGEKIYFWPTEQ